jgi:flagellin
MSTSINTNISALAAQSSLRKTGLAQATSMERLSTGIRINSAKDDAAGLAISTRMTANIRGIAAAIRNANDGISLTQTAEGSLSAIGDNLQRIRELAVQSSNTGNSASDRSAMNSEATQLIAEIDRVASNSAFNGIKLLDGSFQNQDLQIGAGNDSNDRITVSIGNAKASALGVGGGSSYLTKNTTAYQVTSSALASGGITINGFSVGDTSADGVSLPADAANSAIAKANAINAISGTTGVTASVVNTEQSFTATSAGTGFTFTVNGVTITGTPDTASPKTAASTISAAINAVSAQTGVNASVVGDSGGYKLTAIDGRNIVIGGTSAASGAAFVLTGTTFGKINLASNSSSGIVLGGTQISSIGASAGSIAMTTTAGAGVSTLDLSTAAGAKASLNVLDKAINQITDSRASMGAYQNRLTAAISNLETTSTNLAASRSRILDTDYAKETTNLAKSQIITQAATAMLAQANQSAQSVLALLK